MFAASGSLPRNRGPALLAGLFALLIAVAPAPLRAADNPLDTLDQGPQIGANMAAAVKAPDENGQLKDFGALKRKRGLILTFSRSFDW